MDLATTRALYDRHERRAALVYGMVREETEHTLRFVSGGHGPGVVLHANLDEANADAIIGREIERFRSLGQAFEWKLHDYDAPANLEDRLAAHGFVREPEETLVVFDLSAELPVVPDNVALCQLLSSG